MYLFIMLTWLLLAVIIWLTVYLFKVTVHNILFQKNVNAIAPSNIKYESSKWYDVIIMYVQIIGVDITS
jgi:hypothetical protein